VNIKIRWDYFRRPEHNNEIAFKHVTLIDRVTDLTHEMGFLNQAGKSIPNLRMWTLDWVLMERYHKLTL